MATIERLKEKIKSRQEQYDLLNEKIKRLRLDHALENETASKFKYEKQIDIAEAELEKLGYEIDAIEDQLQSVEIGELKAEGPELEQKLEKTLSQVVSIKPIPTLLERYDNFIDTIANNLSNSQSSNKIGELGIAAIQTIRESLGADFSYQIDSDGGYTQIVCASKSKKLTDSFDLVKFNSKIIASNHRIIELNTPHCFENFEYKYENQTITKCIVVPIKTIKKSALIIIGNYSDKFAILTDVIGVILNEIYKSTNGFTDFQSENFLKSTIYDKIKAVYHYVSEQMYKTRYDMFCESLEQIQMYFEPIFCFDEFGSSGGSVTVEWWEALARDKKTKTAPTSLFTTCELWGLQFQTALDLHCLENALKTYNQSIKGKRKEDIKRLSINVYPNTILRSKYRDTLRCLLKDDRLIPKNRLVLEISEKTLITSSSEIEDAHYLDYFKESMRELRRSCWVNFAIDDFGVGNATIQRLNRLLPEFIKIDRDVLLHEYHLSREVIRYLINLASHGRVDIVVEGFDKDCKIPLRELVRDFDVQYIQGHLLGGAVPEIYERLPKEQYAKIITLLQQQ